MAILSAPQLTEVRQRVASSGVPVTYVRAQANAALQAIEDYFESTARAGFAAAIETAVPLTFTAAQKKQLVKHWLLQKAGRE